MHLIRFSLLTARHPICYTRNMTLPSLKQIAYLTLSDANMLQKKVVNPYQLLEQMGLDWKISNNGSSRHLGAVCNLKDGIVLKSFYDASTATRTFAMATMIAVTLIQNVEETVKTDYCLMLPVEKEGDNDLWVHARELATILLCYAFTPRELKMLKAEGLQLEKNISKIAIKRGMPTRYMIRRIALEMAVVSPL